MQGAATDDPVWLSLQGYEIGPRNAALTFAARLARENRWSPDFAGRVICEYRRFCFLAVTAGHEVTPSDAVDQAWHLHLTYSRDYWERFCPEVLGMPLHHGPTAGGTVERDRYFEQYAQTLKSYEAAFDETPPADIWPAAAQRFGRDPLAFRVRPDSVIILPRRPTMIGAAVLAAILVGLGWLLGRWL
jgi:hypothetical protein